MTTRLNHYVSAGKNRLLLGGIWPLPGRTRINFFVTVLFLIILAPARADHVVGTDISYRHIDSFKYAITIRYYRDCYSSALMDTTVQAKIRCLSGGNSYSLWMAIESVKTITSVCSKTALPCNPNNSRKTGPGVEMHTYVAVIDFADPLYKPMLTCGKIIFESGQCCRTGKITACGQWENHYNFATLDLSQGNSSLSFGGPPGNLFLCCNQPVYEFFDVRDNDLCDSISYRLVQPLKGYGSPVGCYSGFSYTRPFTCYDPLNNGKAYPESYPPIGFYFDEVNGGLVFTPTKCDEAGAVAYEAWEWRKDSTGTYRHIGTIRRDIVYFVGSCSANNGPLMSGPFSYTVCEGDSLQFKITTSDKPINSSTDSVKLTWSRLFSDARLHVIDSSLRLPAAKFSWKAKYNDCSYNTHSFTVTARDNNCPINAESTRKYTVKVIPKASGKVKITDHSCGRFQLEGVDVQGVVGIKWNILDPSGAVVSDPDIARFLTVNNEYSGRLSVSLLLLSNDTFQVQMRLWNGSCFSDFYDTLYRAEPHYNLFSYHDTLYCDDQSIRLSPDRSDSTDLTRYQWSTNPGDTLYSISVNAPGIYTFSARTGDGCAISEKITVGQGYSPEVAFIKSDSFCPPFSVRLDTDSLVNNGTLRSGIYWENGDTAATRYLDTQGSYYLAVTNACGSDTSHFSIYAGLIPARAPAIAPIPNDTVCIPFSKVIHAGQITDPKGLVVEYLWENGYTQPIRTISDTGSFRLTARNKCGVDSVRFRIFRDLVPDLKEIPDDTLCVPGKTTIRVEDQNDSGLSLRRFLWNDGGKGDSRVLEKEGNYRVICSALCGADTVIFSLRSIEIPDVDLGPDRMEEFPVQVTLTADTVRGNYLWSTGDTVQSIIVEDTGSYWVTVKNHCGISTDTVHIVLLLSSRSGIGEQIMIRPNPVKDKAKIQLDQRYKHVRIIIRNIQGQVVGENEFNNIREAEVTVPGAPGIYLMEVYIPDGSSAILKILKQ